MRAAIRPLSRYLVTPAVSKHRIFTWVDGDTLPDHALVVFATDDDYLLGILQSKVHVAWSLALGTQLESRPRYTPTTSFETFPFPRPPDSDRAAIAAAAARLEELREGWLSAIDPDDIPRTRTRLYNEMPTWLRHAHAVLDASVFRAYGWDDGGEELLGRLLALNHQRQLGS
jgi:hypothetical protein